MRILSFDPGHTTGWAVVEDGVVEAFDTAPMWVGIDELIAQYKPDVIVFEDFRLYPWMARSKSWSHLETVQVIGVILYLADLAEVPVAKQMASRVKSKLTERRFGRLVSNLPNHAKEAALHALVHYRTLERRKKT